jgi:hypothetical protein
MPYDERFCQQNGFLHGGAVASLAEATERLIATMTSTIIVRWLRRP